jgi:Cof subfamily protein (haloacid dehalogenase superfamily)
MTPRMLVLDLDGTTLTRERGIHPTDEAAIKAAIGAGILVTIATGRLYSGTLPAARRLGISGPVACMNGSEIRDLAGERMLGCFVDRATLHRARRVFARAGVAPWLMTSERLHHCARSESFLPYLRAWTESLVSHEDAFNAPGWTRGDDVLAAGGTGRYTACAAAADALRAEVDENTEVLAFPAHRARAWIVKLRDRREDKGTALRRLAAHHGIDVAATVAVGDWLNDLPMLQAAGRSFAVGQAPDEVKRTATDVCRRTIDQGGAVAEVIDRVWGIRANS